MLGQNLAFDVRPVPLAVAYRRCRPPRPARTGAAIPAPALLWSKSFGRGGHSSRWRAAASSQCSDTPTFHIHRRSSGNARPWSTSDPPPAAQQNPSFAPSRALLPRTTTTPTLPQRAATGRERRPLDKPRLARMNGHDVAFAMGLAGMPSSAPSPLQGSASGLDVEGAQDVMTCRSVWAPRNPVPRRPGLGHRHPRPRPTPPPVPLTATPGPGQRFHRPRAPRPPAQVVAGTGPGRCRPRPRSLPAPACLAAAPGPTRDLRPARIATPTGLGRVTRRPGSRHPPARVASPAGPGRKTDRPGWCHGPALITAVAGCRRLLRRLLGRPLARGFPEQLGDAWILVSNRRQQPIARAPHLLLRGHGVVQR